MKTKLKKMKKSGIGAGDIRDELLWYIIMAPCHIYDEAGYVAKISNFGLKIGPNCADWRGEPESGLIFDFWILEEFRGLGRIFWWRLVP